MSDAAGGGSRATARHVCVAGVLRLDGCVLLCHRHPDRAWYPNTWDLPGGHVQPGESHQHALVRELKEELGVDVNPPWEPPFERTGDDRLGVDLSVWLIDEWHGHPCNRATEEHDRIGWFGAGSYGALALAHPAYVVLLDRALRA